MIPAVFAVLGIVAFVGLMVVIKQTWRAPIKLGILAGLAVVLAAIAFLFGFQSQIYGWAIVAKPLTGATVQVYALRSDGRPGALLATTTTDDTGYYNLDVRRPPWDALLVTTAGGSYVDEISKKTVTAGSNNSLKAAVPAGSQQLIGLTPLSTFAVARMSTLAASNKPLRASIDVSNRAVARQYNLTTVTAVAAVVADDSQDNQVASPEERELGLILAGLDTEAAALGVSEMALTDAIAQDLSDGDLDGKAGSAPVTIDPAVALPPDAGLQKLQDDINHFSATPENVTHLPAPQISVKALHIDLNGAGLFYVSSTVLPAWHDGEAGSATIGGSGGVSPYTCALTAGSAMPPGFTLSPDCVISGTPPPLAGGSVMNFGPPFSVTVSDTSQPVQSVVVELRITVLQKPPTVVLAPANCPGEGQPCSVVIASGKGGTPPYYYYTDTFLNGSPPLGMVLWLDGTLKGTPAKAGTYTFDVCVVDLVGGSSCSQATVTVGPTASPSPTDSAVTSETPGPSNNPNVPAGFPTNLTPGNYDMQICTDITGCIDGGIFPVSSGDFSALADAIAQYQASQAGCSGSCNAAYSAFDGTTFTVTFTTTDCSTGTCVTGHATLRFTKVG